MGKIFTLITQLRNLTQSRVGFEIVGGGGRCSLTMPVLPPGKTRPVKLHRILRYSREYGSDWKLRVCVDDRFTGIELESSVLLNHVRIVFSHENGSGVLFVEGVPENCSDFLLRHKYFGCMRNIFWNERPRGAIDRSDSRLATKLRDLEGHYHGQHLAPFADATLLKKRISAQLLGISDYSEFYSNTPTSDFTDSEGSDGQHLAPIVDTTLLKKSQFGSPMRKLIDKNTIQTTKKADDGTNYVAEVVPPEKPKIILSPPPLPPQQTRSYDFGEDTDDDSKKDSHEDSDKGSREDSDKDADDDSEKSSHEDSGKDPEKDSDEDSSSHIYFDSSSDHDEFSSTSSDVVEEEANSSIPASIETERGFDHNDHYHGHGGYNMDSFDYIVLFIFSFFLFLFVSRLYV